MILKLVRLRPPRVAIVLLGLAAAVQWGTPLPSIYVAAWPVLGVALGCLGFLVMMVAWWQFRQRNVGICPTDSTSELITDGIYRLTRNPMYLGMVLMLIGVAFVLGVLPFFVATLVYFLILNGLYCPFEEAKLSAAFGPAYLDYSRRVRRWL